MCDDDNKQRDILEKIFGKDALTEELEKELTDKNELITIFNGGLKSLPGKRTSSENTFLCFGGMASRHAGYQP